MLLRLSHFKLNSYVVLVVSKQKGITLVFKTDPLQNVDINSTFDSIAVIQKFIQKEIEGQLRQMFREDLPGIIHRLSQQWVKAKVEAPYLNRKAPLSRRHTIEVTERHEDTSAINDCSFPPRRPPRSVVNAGGSCTSSSLSVASSRRTYATAKSALPPPTHDHSSLSPELEHFDPTYGLRPDGLPAKSVFRSFSQLHIPNKGLADLTEDPSEDNQLDDETSFDVVDWDDVIPDISLASSVYDGREHDNVEYETIPAVGGGTITRPRVYHSQSQIQPPPGITHTRNGPPPLAGLAQMNDLHLQGDPLSGSHQLRSHHKHIPEHGPRSNYTRSRSLDLATGASDFYAHPPLHRPRTPDSLETQASGSTSSANNTHFHSLPTPPFTDIAPLDQDSTPLSTKRAPLSRRSSLSHSNTNTSFQLESPPNTLRRIPEPDPTIILRPSLNNTIHQLSTLSHSNHTLSPFTRSLSHFTVRSVPPRGPAATGADRQQIKARRKRIHRLGSAPQPRANQDLEAEPPPVLLSPHPPSEFDAEDLDRYFRSQDSDFIPNSPNIHPTHLRSRHAHQYLHS
jgi:distribution and morphology protein 34